MTFVETVLLGIGTLLICSALDNTPIGTTFQKIVTGQPINLLQNEPPGATATNPAGIPPFTSGVNSTVARNPNAPGYVIPATH